MQLRDLQKQYKALKPQIDEAISSVLNTSSFIMGKVVADLEAQLAQYVGVRHCVACANGTDALRLALMAWEVGPGDAVFVPDFTFFASAEVVAAQGATPIFVDVDRSTYNISISDLESKVQQVITKGALKAKAIVAVDLFGQPADFLQIREIADLYQLRILEDGAQGFGGSIWKERACSFGDISTTSFFPAKPLGCYGDGGAIFTNDDDWAQLLRSFVQHGKGSEKYDNVRIGTNSRLDALQAAILQVKLNAFPDELAKVNHVAQTYTSLLHEVVTCPMVLPSHGSSWAQYTIQTQSLDQRNQLQQYLRDRSVPTAIYYPKPMHLQTAFAQYAETSCPNASELSSTVLSLPMHPYLTDEDIHFVSDSIISFMNKQ